MTKGDYERVEFCPIDLVRHVRELYVLTVERKFSLLAGVDGNDDNDRGRHSPNRHRVDNDVT